MRTNIFSPSINIIRDQNSELNYIPTRNAENAFNKIVSTSETGTKSFNLIGAYGSGKSSFLLAFERVLNNKSRYFVGPSIGEVKEYKKSFIVGEYNSFKNAFCKELKLDSKKDILQQLSKRVQKLKKDKNGLIIAVDEFGKFLEFAAKESPEEELYFIQQLAEYVNNPGFPLFFITTLHQPFEDYALELSKVQKKEWDKVKGRLIEVTFNEPVEQLLFLASERIASKNIPNNITKEHQRNLFEAISQSGAFPMRDYFSFEFAQKVFPFDILSASVLTLAFQTYGQNERSLFTFLESHDYLGLSDFGNGDGFYNIANVYDYLIYNFHSLLNSRFNPHGVHWRAIDDALGRAEAYFEGDLLEARKILKTIGLLSIFGRSGQKISSDFLIGYGEHALALSNVKDILEKLERKQLIRYRNYSDRYVLFKGTDFNIIEELELASDKISKDFSVVNLLRKQFNFPILQAKRSFYETGTPRYFVTEITEQPINKEPQHSVDGYINLIYSDTLSIEDVIRFSKSNSHAILYGVYTNFDDVRESLIELEKIELVKQKCNDDSIALGELESQSNELKAALNKIVEKSFFGENAFVKWFFQGEEVSFRNSKSLNSFLSNICDITYYSTPIYKNELINREKLSGTISGAKNRLINNALINDNVEDLRFDKGKFPPEKTIYLSLLKATGLHGLVDGEYQYCSPSDNSFNDLWNISEEFLDECKVAPRFLSDLIKKLSERPLKLKQGFIEFWVPVYLIIKRRTFALYEKDTFIPEITGDIIEIAMKQPQKYKLNTFALDENKLKLFNKYRHFLNQVEEVSPNSNSFIETVKPFLSFYKRLVLFSQNTNQISKEAQRLRVVLAHTEDPEKVFFDEIPRAIGYSTKDLFSDESMESFTIALKNATSELSAAYSELINRIEEYINSIIDSSQLSFPENKLLLQKRFKKIRKEHLKTKNKVLLQRINTPLDDRQSWLTSIASAVVNKTPNNFSDDDEKAFQNLFQQYISDLDNISDISKKDIDSEKEEVLKLEVTSFVKGVQKHLIRMPKVKSRRLDEKKNSIREFLSSEDKQENITLLLKLLQEEIDNE
ncbi:hypothetical protein [Labilibacter marinus]|uniref:hypothetical protein n=1 Tax=Labilibacter marinus TaxID=1477105 RepID=UPI0009FA9554|nr:hypothetical protein [Labilibacter marinus]